MKTADVHHLTVNLASLPVGHTSTIRPIVSPSITDVTGIKIAQITATNLTAITGKGIAKTSNVGQLLKRTKKKYTFQKPRNVMDIMIVGISQTSLKMSVPTLVS